MRPFFRFPKWFESKPKPIEIMVSGGAVHALTPGEAIEAIATDGSKLIVTRAGDGLAIEINAYAKPRTAPRYGKSKRNGGSR